MYLCKISPLPRTEVVPFVFVSYWPLEGTNASGCSACCYRFPFQFLHRLKHNNKAASMERSTAELALFFSCTYKDGWIGSENYYLHKHAQAGPPARSVLAGLSNGQNVCTDIKVEQEFRKHSVIYSSCLTRKPGWMPPWTRHDGYWWAGGELEWCPKKDKCHSCGDELGPQPSVQWKCHKSSC